MSNDFWEYSLATYQADGLAQAALAVQDELGLDINLILYASWLASRGLKLTNIHLDGLATAIGRWQREVVIPLRAVRRELKGVPDVDVLRDRVKSIELDSEKHQQQLMWEYFKTSDPLMPGGATLLGNLALLVEPGTKDTACWNSLLDKLSRVSRA